MKTLVRLALVLLVACDAASAYVYTGRVYDPQGDCLGPETGFDLLTGSDPGSSCGAKCIAAKSDDGGLRIIISTMCGPAPYNADISGSSPLCVPALAAQSSGAYCSSSDAGSD